MRWLGYALLALLALAAAYILLLAVAALAVDPGREYPSESRFYRRLLDGAVRVCLCVSRVKLRTEGLETLPEGPFFLFSNNCFNYYSFVIWYALK